MMSLASDIITLGHPMGLLVLSGMPPKSPHWNMVRTSQPYGLWISSWGTGPSGGGTLASIGWVWQLPHFLSVIVKDCC